MQYPGAIYHVMNRGDRREAIFLDDQDRELFLETLGGGLRENRLAGPCVVSDEQSFPCGERDASGQLGGGDAVVSGSLYQPVQPSTQGVWAFIQRALQGATRGGQRGV